MQQRIKIIITAIWAVLAVSIGADEASVIGPWVTETEALGPVRWLEMEIETGPEGLQGSIDGFAQVGTIGFDAPIIFDLSWKELELKGNRLRGHFELRGRSLVLNAVFHGNRIEGTISDGEGEQPFTGYRIENITEEEFSPLVGIYDEVPSGRSSLIVTWREFGGLRAVDLEQGDGAILDPVDRGRFASRTPNAWGATTFSFERRPETGMMLVTRTADSGEVRYIRRKGFDQERVSFTSQGITLSGTLFRPPTEDPVPAVILVHGSGPIYRTALVDRAASFVELGGAAFIYDKRGTGQSEGNWRNASFEDLAADALAALRRIGKISGIDGERLGFQGHSQAGWVIPLAAAGHPDVAFAIIVNGGAIETGETTLWDKEHDLRREGYPPSVIEEALDLLRRVHAYVGQKKGDLDTLRDAYRAAQEQPWFPILDLPRLRNFPSWEDPPPLLVAAHQELSFDHSSAIQRMDDIPILVLLGAEDETVPPLEVAAAWRAHAREQDRENLRIEIVPHADHGFRNASKDGPSARLPSYDAIQLEWWDQHVASVPTDSEGQTR